jgi:hypothetical protein
LRSPPGGGIGLRTTKELSNIVSLLVAATVGEAQSTPPPIPLAAVAPKPPPIVALFFYSISRFIMMNVYGVFYSRPGMTESEWIGLAGVDT